MLLDQLLSTDIKFQTFLQNYISIFIISKKSKQSLQLSVRYSPDKSSVVSGTPVCQPYSPTFLVLKPSCIFLHPCLPYHQTSEQSVKWLLRTVSDKIWAERKRSGRKGRIIIIRRNGAIQIKVKSLSTSFQCSFQLK